MFENANKSKSLMIVYDDKSKACAEYLVSLIGQKDDKDDQIIGIKDGSVTAAIRTVKQYNDSLPTLSSNNHIVFLGTFKEAKEHAQNIDLKFNYYGMKFGWLGKRAVLYVDEVMEKKDKYDEFFEFAKKYETKIEKANRSILNEIPRAVKWAGMFLLFPEAVEGLVLDYNLRNKIKNQQYKCLTMAFYLDGLQEFMEG